MSELEKAVKERSEQNSQLPEIPSLLRIHSKNMPYGLPIKDEKNAIVEHALIICIKSAPANNNIVAYNGT